MQERPVTKDYSQSIILEEFNPKTAAVSIDRDPGDTHVRCEIPVIIDLGISEDVSDRCREDLCCDRDCGEGWARVNKIERELPSC